MTLVDTNNFKTSTEVQGIATDKWVRSAESSSASLSPITQFHLNQVKRI
jgi:hypothetical protein